MTPKDKARFWAKVSAGPGCWEWTGGRSNNGYGMFPTYKGQDRKWHLAHRVSYMFAHGPIAPGLVIMHGCDNPGCVNPAHLSAGTQKDNMRDALTKGRSNLSGLALGRAKGIKRRRSRAVATHCRNGHDYTPENTFINSRGYRECKTCRKVSWTRHNAKLSERRRGDLS